MAGAPARKSLEKSWRHLEAAGERMPPPGAAGRPFVPARMPSYDDAEPLGFSYFRHLVEDADNSNLTLPRTFFGRSLLRRVSFANTDLFESRMCWNDFEACDFSGADLSGCDLRASIFEGCKFVETILHGADLRRSSFKDCDFTGADLTGAVAESNGPVGGVQAYLTAAQQADMTWVPDSGPAPPGG